MRENFMVHVVDSDQAIADGLATLLGTYGFDVLAHPDGESFLEYWLRQHRGNCCLITEADLPGLSGAAWLRELHELGADIPVLMLASESLPEMTLAAPGCGRISVIRKPCLDRTLIDRVLDLRAGVAQARHCRHAENQ